MNKPGLSLCCKHQIHCCHYAHYIEFSYKWVEQRSGSDRVSILHMVALEIVAFTIDDQWL